MSSRHAPDGLRRTRRKGRESEPHAGRETRGPGQPILTESRFSAGSFGRCACSQGILYCVVWPGQDQADRVLTGLTTMATAEAIARQLNVVRETGDGHRLKETFSAISQSLESNATHNAGLEALVICSETALQVVGHVHVEHAFFDGVSLHALNDCTTALLRSRTWMWPSGAWRLISLKSEGAAGGALGAVLCTWRTPAAAEAPLAVCYAYSAARWSPCTKNDTHALPPNPGTLRAWPRWMSRTSTSCVHTMHWQAWCQPCPAGSRYDNSFYGVGPALTHVFPLFLIRQK